MTRVANLMNRGLQSISYDVVICDAAEKMMKQKISSLLIEKDGEVVGIVTDTDIVRKAAAKRLPLDREKVGTVMSNPIVSLDISRSPEDAFDLMGEIGTRHLAVTDRGKIVGILSVRDLLIYFRKQSEPQMGVD
jgi:signal-transduction protein with cAMP-binding, CBS, and nucleotidyltransferase domain